MVKRYEQSFKETLVELYDSGQSVTKKFDHNSDTKITLKHK